MSKIINPDDIPTGVLKEYINNIQAIYNYKSISYHKIKKELKDLYGIEVSLERIEENCVEDAETADLVQQFKNLGIS